ncbi:MAG: hypothetical protein SynsKO_30800 [Synoicihabitans sp.]
MHLPRRTFLRTSVGFAVALPFTRLQGQSATSGSSDASDRAPGLLFDPADLPRIRRNLEHPRLTTVREKLRNVDHAERLQFIRHESSLRNRVRHMREIREALENAAFAFAVWEDPRDLELATAALQRILQYDPWDYFLEGDSQPIGFQRAPEATIAVCTALDWIGDHFDPALVAEAEHQVATKGAPACFLSLYGLMYPDRVKGWSINHRDDDIPADFDLSRWPLILNSTNLKIIPTCALGFAALWLHGRHPQANRWLQMARRSAQSFAPMYGLDGSYDEGVGYWGYTTLHMAMLAEAVHRRLGIDERDLINYEGSTRFATVMSMPRLGSAYNNPNEKEAYNFVPKGTLDPAIDIVNFGDSGNGTDTTIAAWTGRTHDDPYSNYAAANMGAIKHLPGAIWFDPSAPTASPPDEWLNARLDNDWIVSRSDWSAASTVLALRSGGPANHEHADRNSLIFKAHGERLFHDPFKAAYSPTHPRWLLRLTEAHTAVLIDGQGHQYHDGSEGTNASWARATVTGYQADASNMQVTSDATEAYQLVLPHVERVDRSVLYLKPDVLLILDRLKMKADHVAELSARFQVFNEDDRGEVSVEGEGFAISRPFAGLQANCFTHDGIPTVVHRQLELPADEGSFPFVESFSRKENAPLLLTVVAAAPQGEAITGISAKSTRHGWRVRGTHRGLKIDVAVDTTKPTLPFT